MNVTIRVDRVYGNVLMYPVCEKAHLFAAIAGTKTLSKRDIANIRALGYEVRQQHTEVSL